MRNLKAGVCFLVLVFVFPCSSSALKKEEDKRAWFSFGLSYNQFFFDDDIYEDVFDEESFGGMGLSLGLYPLRNLEVGASARALYMDGYAIGFLTEEESGEEFNLQVYPLQLSLSYRFDFLHEQAIVPFVTGGGDYYLYREERDFGEDTEGGKAGYHGGGGIGILLDRLDPESAASLQKEFGVQNVFLDLRYEADIFEEEEEGLDFSNTSWQGRLFFEF